MHKTMAASLVVLVAMVAQGWADEKAKDAKLNDADRELFLHTLAHVVSR